MKLLKVLLALLVSVATCFILSYPKINDKILTPTPQVLPPPPPPPSPPIYPPLPPAGNFQYPEITFNKGYLKYFDGIPVMTVQGTPTEMGEQIGKMAIIPAKRIHTYPREMLDKFIPRPIIANIVWGRMINAGEELLHNSPIEYQQEFKAISRSMDYDLLVAANTMFDVKNTVDIQVGCSSIAISKTKSENGSVIMGRNFDYSSNGYLHNYTILTIYKSPGKKTFASLAFPGLIGCFTGINEDGLCISTLEVTALNENTTKFNENGYPYAFCYRKLLEECSTVQEAQVKLASLPIDTATNLAVCDKNTAAVFEVTPDGMESRSFENEICTCANHFCRSRFRPMKQENFGKTIDRLNALNKRGNSKEKLSLADIQLCLDDANSGESTLQCVIMEPDKLRINIGVGACPATKLRLRAIELKNLLSK